MSDKRIALSKGYELELNNMYYITEEVGRGSSCIVYSAYYVDDRNLKHNVRIKECYPYDMDIVRCCDGELQTAVSFEKRFCDAKKQFCDAYENSVALKNTSGFINSITDPVGIFSWNNTWYIVISYVEGEDYHKAKDEDLQSVFVRILALSEIIKKCHGKGLLYLDIKPENMLVIPETKEHVYLFDFDSVVDMTELKSNPNVRISFSEGYAAPELVQGRRNKICEATDIYSIGATVFKRIMGRMPTIKDCSMGVEFDFSKMNYGNQTYRPELFRKLKEFFHKTISITASCRYQNMDAVIERLKELMELSDVEKPFLIDNFTYNSPNFVGRRQELEEISVMVESNQAVFLSGIGGIGKTEVAKRYAFENREHYRNIVFLSFDQSIVYTVCGEDLRINGIERDENEEDNVYFRRKLDMLIKVAKETDLIILDNFDVEMDEDLEELLECKCKFLITTREDFRDFNYAQINIDEMENVEDLVHLFQSYNDTEYSEAEKESICEIIELVDRHTMAVELIAKYLYATDVLPSELYEKILDKKKGITNTQRDGIKHRKDKKLRIESINNHLLILFDLSVFDEEEQELIMSLALLGYVRISKAKFMEYCNTKNNEAALDKLIRRGWIEHDDISGKISLHQIILDLVYNQMNPTAEKCPHILKSMTLYTTEETENYAARDVRRKVLEYFLQRISGGNVEYAKFLVSYCQNIRKRMEYLENAEKICNENDDIRCKELLREIALIKIRILEECDDAFETDMDTDEYMECQGKIIADLANRAFQYELLCENDPGILGEFCVKTAYVLDQAVETMEMYAGFGECEGLNIMLKEAEELLLKAEAYIIDSNLENDKKVKLFRKIRDFYKDEAENFCAMYRPEHCADFEKVSYYQELIYGLEEKKKETVYMLGSDGDVLYMDYGNRAMQEGEYEKAIEYFEKAIEDEEDLYDIMIGCLADAYLKADQSENAITLLKEAIEQDNDYSLYRRLIDVFLSEDKVELAKEYLEKWLAAIETDIDNQISEGETEYLTYDLRSVIEVLVKKYKLENDLEEKENIWMNCMKYYQMYDKYHLEKDADIDFDFYEIYMDKMETVEEKLKFATQMANKYAHDWMSTNCSGEFYKYAIRISEGAPEIVYEHVLILLLYSNMLNYDRSFEVSYEYCQQAMKIYEEEQMSDEYLQSLIYKNQAEYYHEIKDDYEKADEIKGNCNYYLLAERMAEGQSEDRQIELWKEAAFEYSLIDNYPESERCFSKVFEIWDRTLNKDDDWDVSNYRSECFSRIKNLINSREVEKVVEISMQLYQLLADRFGKVSLDDDMESKASSFSWDIRNIADFFAEIMRTSEAVILYLIQLVFSLDYNANRILATEVELYFQGELKYLLDEVNRVLHGDLTSKMVDDAIDTWEKISTYVEQDSRFDCLQDEFKCFLDTYKHQNIEFKR